MIKSAIRILYKLALENPEPITAKIIESTSNFNNIEAIQFAKQVDQHSCSIIFHIPKDNTFPICEVFFFKRPTKGSGLFWLEYKSEITIVTIECALAVIYSNFGEAIPGSNPIKGKHLCYNYIKIYDENNMGVHVFSDKVLRTSIVNVRLPDNEITID